MGDVYFKQNSYEAAGEWFARAIQANPDRETAYRYWGDALASMGKASDARAKYIEAIIAEPYNRSSWVGIGNWAQRAKLPLNFVRLKDGARITMDRQKDGKQNINITIDDSFAKGDPNGTAWMSYGIGRASWHTEKLEKEFPGVPRDRHTLQEEAHALGLMVTVMKQQKDFEEMVSRLDPSLQALIKIQEAGFLDPFVLLNRADPEIAQDYLPYRAAHRDLIRRYLDEFVVPKIPAN